LEYEYLVTDKILPDVSEGKEEEGVTTNENGREMAVL